MKRLVVVGILLAAGCNWKVGLRAKDVEKSLGEKLSKRAGATVTVDCPGATLDGKVTCAISAADGTNAKIEIDAKPKESKWTSDLNNVAFGKQVADDIQKTFGDKYGLEADSIACPAIIVRGNDTDCQATIRTLTLPVHLTTSGETLGYSTDSGMILGANAKRVAEEMLAKNGAAAAVTCGFNYRWAVPGETFSCDSPRGKIVFTIKDSKGNVDLALDTAPAGATPPPAPAAP